MDKAPETLLEIGGWVPCSRRWTWRDLLALLAWTSALVFFFREFLFQNKTLFYFDVSEINYPYRAFFISELLAGRFSRWCPGLYCGLPLFSESQAGYLHPLKYLFYPWMATWRALSLDTIASIWLAGFGTYLWLRRRVSPPAALGGAALFALSGFTWAHWMHTSMINALASVPFAVWSLEVAWERARFRWIVPGALALACQVFAGHLQDALLTMALLVVYTVFRVVTESTWRKRVQAGAFAILMLTLGVLLSAVQWIPSKELLDRSPRAGGLSWDDLVFASWSPELLPTMLVREAFGTRAKDTDWMDGYYPYHEMDVYMGAVGLSLAVIGASARRDRWVGFWTLLAGVAFVLMLGKFTCLFDYANRLPIAGASREPVRFHLWAALAVSALAAVGLERLARPGAVSFKQPGVFLGVLIASSIPILIHDYVPVWTDASSWVKPYHIARYRWLGWELALSTIRSAAILATAFFIARRAVGSTDPKLRRRIVWALPVVVIVDLLSAHANDVPSVDSSYWTDPPTSAKLLQSELGEVRLFGVAQFHSGEPGYASEPFNFLPVRDTLDWSLPIAWGLKSSSGKTPIIPARMLRYTDNAKPRAGRFDVDSVTHLLVPAGEIIGMGRPSRVGLASVYRNRRALPRARLSGRPVYATDEHDAVQIMRRLGGEIRERLIVEDPTRPMAEDARAEGSARIVVDLPEMVELEIDAKTPCYAFLADTFDPGWSALLDDKPAEIRPAQIAFRAVFVEKGKHKLLFTYKPAGFDLGFVLTCIGGVLCAVCLILPLRLPELDMEHRELGWPRRWLLWFLIGTLALVAVSAVGFDSKGRPRIHSRWTNAFHPFTWGSGLKAMGPPRPPMD